MPTAPVVPPTVPTAAPAAPIPLVPVAAPAAPTIPIAPATIAGLTVKAKEFQKLGKEKDQVPYYRWKQLVESRVRALGGHIYLSPHDLTGLSADVVAIHERNDASLYSALFEAVMQVPTLADKVSKCANQWGSTAKAWEAIKAFFIRAGDHNEPWLDSKLGKLAPAPGESMEVFLNRCERLRNEYESYGLLLDDARLIRQVKLKLSRP